MTLPSGVRAVRKKLADGSVKIYYYHRLTGAPLPPPDDPNFRKAFAEAHPKHGRYAPGTIGKLLTDYRQSPEWRAKKRNTQRKQLHYMYPLEIVHHIQVSEITRGWVMQMRDRISAQKGNAAANAFAQVCAAVFAWGRDRGWIEHSPLDRMKSLPGGHWPGWTEQQFDQARERLPEHMRRVIVLARYTGQRRGDLCSMLWSQYDGRTISLKQQKTGAELVIPVHSVLKAELDQWRQSATSTHILTTSQGVPWTHNHVSVDLPRWLRKAGLPRGLNVHGLRKLAAASLAEAGCSTKEIAAITGHATLAMVELYTKGAQQPILAEAAIIRLETRDGNRAATKRIKR